MRHEPHVVEAFERSAGFDEDADTAVDLGWVATLAGLPRDACAVMLIVAEEPLRGALLELAHAHGFDAFACETPLDVIHTLVEIEDRIACAIVSVSATWGEGLGEFLADEYPQIERVLIES